MDPKLNLQDSLAQLWRDRINLPAQQAARDAFDLKVELLRYQVSEGLSEIANLQDALGKSNERISELIAVQRDTARTLADNGVSGSIEMSQSADTARLEAQISEVLAERDSLASAITGYDADQAAARERIHRLEAQIVDTLVERDSLAASIASRDAELAAARQRIQMLETVLTSALRRPYWPVGEYLKRRLAMIASGVLKPFSKRHYQRLRNSAKKRDPRRFLSNRDGKVGFAVPLQHPQDYQEQTQNIIARYFPQDFQEPASPLHILLGSGPLVRNRLKKGQRSRAVRQLGRPSFSIITPFFAHLDFFSHCAESVGNLAISDEIDFEWIIVNDDPSIPDHELQRRLPASIQSRTRVISDGKNHGITRALDRGIRSAGKMWAVLLDCDDLLEPNAIAVLSEAAIANPHCRYFTSLMSDIDESGKVLRKRMPGGDVEDLFEKGMVAGHLVAFRRDLYEELGGFDERHSGVQDYDFALRVAAQEPITRIDNHLYRYRWHAKTQSISRLNRQARLADAVRTTFLRETLELSVPPSARSPLPETPSLFCVIRTQGHRMELLAAAIASVQNQAFPVTPCVVVHGDDEAFQFVRRHLPQTGFGTGSAQSPIVLHAPRTDLKRGYPCNVALEYLRAHADQFDLLCFLDDDDHILPSFAERLVLSMRLRGSDIAYGLSNALPKSGEPFPQHKLMPWVSILAANFIAFNSFIARVDAVLETGAAFRTDMHYLEDHHFLVQLIGAGLRASPLPEVVAEYRLLGDGNSDDKKHMEHFEFCRSAVNSLAASVAKGLRPEFFWDDVLCFPSEDRDAFGEWEIVHLRKAFSLINPRGAFRD